MITPKQVFDILKDQHILKSQLSYEELSTTKNFILIKKHFKEKQVYWVDLWMSFFRLNPEYENEHTRPKWITDTLLDNSNSYSTQINDAAIYNKIEHFNDYFLMYYYEFLVDDFLHQSDEQNESDYGNKNPLADITPFEIVTISHYQLKQQLKPFSNQKYKNLAHFYQTKRNDLETEMNIYRKKAKNKILNINKQFNDDNRFYVLRNDTKLQQHLNHLLKRIDINYDNFLNWNTKIEFPTEDEYSTKHLSKLY